MVQETSSQCVNLVPPHQQFLLHLLKLHGIVVISTCNNTASNTGLATTRIFPYLLEDFLQSSPLHMLWLVWVFLEEFETVLVVFVPDDSSYFISVLSTVSSLKDFDQPPIGCTGAISLLPII